MASIEIDGANGVIKSTVSDSDLTIKGNDGGSEISALTFDMSDAGTATFNHDIKLGNDQKAIFGASGNLEIYADATNAYIAESGGSGNLVLSGQTIRLAKSDGEIMLEATNDAGVDIRHNHVTKLETTASGIDITGGFTATAASTITTADNTDTLSLISTDADASAGPNLQLYRNSSSPADNDFLGNVKFVGRNDNSQDVQAAEIEVYLTDVSDGAEDGLYNINVMTNGTNNTYIQARADEGVVINNDSIDIDFRVESDINTASLIVEGSSGHVGFGVSNPSSVIDVRNGVGERQAFVFMGVNQDTVAMAIMSSYALSSQTATMIQFLDFNGTERGSIKTSGSATAYNTSSDYRLKENINYDWDATTELKKLKPAKFNWKVDTENTVEGFLAHEVSDIVPDAITGTKDEIETKTKVIRDSANQILGEGIEEADWIAGKVDGKYPSDSTWQASETKEKYQQIDQSKLVPLMVKTIQELEARIKTLEDA